MRLKNYRGNADDYPDPGEGVQLQLTLGNSGNGAGERVTGVLSSPASSVIVPLNTATWPDIGPGSQENSEAPHFDLQIDPAYPCDASGQSVPLTLLVYTEGSERPEVLDFELPLGNPVPFSLFEDDLEPAPLPGWIYFSPSAAWTLKNSTDPQHNTSPTHSWFVPNWDFEATTVLRSPVFEDLPLNARLRFQHRFKTENDKDGGVLEYTIDAGASWHDINYDLANDTEK